ncbi:hypothetical protein ABZ379_46500 [Streptomyces canus]|uniref:hypothetical protein n=1 Tax=Streptomyces canus TaxID=58343 RepID=UPI0033FA9908
MFCTARGAWKYIPLETRWAHPPYGFLQPARSGGVFLPSAYIHIGGEECPTAEWTHSASAAWQRKAGVA